jgi:uncharacterized repeat protein (TIGR01451 family)
VTAVQAEHGYRNQTSIDEMSVHHRVRTPFGLEENKEDSQMRRSLSVAILLLFAAVSAGAAFAQSPVLKGEMAAAKIVVDEDKGEIALSADKVYPNDMVEYTLKYTNSGTATAAGVDLIGPVPAGTVYIEKTATNIPGLKPMYSIDQGKTWHEAPVIVEVARKDGTVEKKKADPEMITHVKWSMAANLDVGEEIMVSYRVHVK